MISGLPNEWEPLAKVLRPGERLLWSGRPDPSKHLTRADLFLIPFSLMWLSFAGFWEIGVLTTDAPSFFPFWGGLFIAIGLYYAFGRFVVKKRRKQRTVYAITDQRAIVLDHRGSQNDHPLPSQPASIIRSRNGRHVSVTLGGDGGGWSWTRAGAQYRNTGMDLFADHQGGLSFFDVSDSGPMLAALDQARQQSTS